MRFILLLLILPSSTYAQKWVDTDSEKHPIENKIAALIQTELMVELDTASIKSFLKNRLPNLKDQNVNLMLENQIASPKGVHYRFSQTINDRKVYRGSVKLNVDNDGRLLSLFDHTFEVPNFLDSEFPNHQPYHDGLMVHYETPVSYTHLTLPTIYSV